MVEMDEVCSVLTTLRGLVKRYKDSQQYSSAEVWADKAVTLSNHTPCDVIDLAQCYYLTSQYHRAAHLLKLHKLDRDAGSGTYLAARSYHAANQHQQAAEILDATSQAYSPGDHKMESAIQVLRGDIYEALDNRLQAEHCYKEALKKDVFCYSAFHALVRHQMLTQGEEQQLIASLPLDDQCSPAEAQLVKFIYESKLNKYTCTETNNSTLITPPSTTSTLQSPAFKTPITNQSIIVTTNIVESLKANNDLLVVKAERYYYQCNYRACYKLAQSILKTDPYQSECLPIYIACLVELNKSNDLFKLAHNLVDLNSQSALSWFAVGCYYYLIGKYDPARKYLNKATTLDRLFGPAWIAYGHAFAVENEHDQAMAAYYKAVQLMKGCHLPMLYVGLQYGLTNNLPLADQYFKSALAITL